MTAEIAILNRSALALAADSAVQISVGGKTKVYDTAEKLFEFSRNQPIALMIYNNVEFVGVPMDVLIRKFRKEREKSPNYASMKEATDDFLEYMRCFSHEMFEEEKYLYLVLRDPLKRIWISANSVIRGLLTQILKGGEPDETPDGVLINLLTKQADVEKARPLPGFLSRVTLARFKKRFAKVIERACRDTFKGMEVTPDILDAAYELAFRLMKSKRDSDLVTGLVFGGFAEKDMFPTVRYLEIDGVYFNQLKVLSTNEVDIDRKTTRAEVVPFAQKEMVERFMYGLDTELEGEIRSFVGKALDEVLAATTKESDEDIKKSVKDKVNKRYAKMMKGLKESSRQDLLDIVYFMSKKELADIAYALVELTSHKRRFSTDEQTVGGPIDVAIITKSEGLVWIRRKHYFGPEVNQSYYSRAFGQLTGGNDDSKKADGQPEAAGV